MIKEKSAQGGSASGGKTEEAVKFKGRFIEAIGKRKTASASVRLYKTGAGHIIVNGMDIEKYFTADQAVLATTPLKVSGFGKEFDFSVVTSGGGKTGQADAVKLGITRALVEFNAELKPILKAKDLITRDSRRKERKKPGLKRARRAPQWAKR